MTDHLKTIRELLPALSLGSVTAYKAVKAALDALEQAMREPVAIVVDDGKPEGSVEWMARQNGPLKAGDFLYAASSSRTKGMTISNMAGAIDAATRRLNKDIVALCAQINYMVGIAERGTNSKCPDDASPELFVLNYVKQLEAQIKGWREVLEFAATHLSSDWPERCQQIVRNARKVLAAPPAQQNGVTLTPEEIEALRHTMSAAVLFHRAKSLGEVRENVLTRFDQFFEHVKDHTRPRQPNAETSRCTCEPNEACDLCHPISRSVREAP